MSRLTPVLVALLCMAATGSAALKTYEVVPCSNYIARAGEYEPVTQYFRNTVDSLWKVSVWVGDVRDTSSFFVAVSDSGDYEVAEGHASPGAESWRWLDVVVEPYLGRKPIRGKTYKVVISRTSGSPIEFAYSPHNPYHFGDAVVSGSTPPLPDSADAALRVYGLMRPADSTFWAAYPYFPFGGEQWGLSAAVWRERAMQAGLHRARLRVAWTWVDSARDGAWHYEGVNWQYANLKDSIGGCEVYCNLYSCTESTSTRRDSTWNDTTSSWRRTMSIDCPPCSMALPINSPHNYWARFVEKTVRQFDAFGPLQNNDSIRVWEIWNEPNILFNYWKKPDTADYSHVASVWQRCSLYVELCKLADSVIRLTRGDWRDRVLVGSLGDLDNFKDTLLSAVPEDHDTLIIQGKVWLRWMYEIAELLGYGVFWDGVAFHYYRSPSLALFEADAETLRAIMRENGDFGQLWITETGWPTGTGENEHTPEVQANAVARVFTTSLASTANPGGGYDRVDWFCFRNTGGANPFHFGFADTMMTVSGRKASFYAFAQTGAALTSKRFNGRAIVGEPAMDAHVLAYEFEDASNGRKTWVAWRSDSTGAAQFPFPCRVDQPDTVSLAYTGSESPGSINVDANGWLPLTVGTRPVFISEPATDSILRPDIAVDTFWLDPSNPQVGKPLKLKCWMKNTSSSRATPESCTTLVVFTLNGSALDTARYVGSIAPGDSVLMQELVTPEWDHHGHGLFAAEANPGQRYVELSTDDNTAWLRRYVSLPPHSAIDVTTPGNGRSDVPRVILNLSSISFENDSLPCESLLLLQARFGLGDSVPDTIIASGWFGAKTCTTWQFLAGEGHYRFACLSSDSGGNISDTAWHDTVGFITFDSTPPPVSVAVNSGEAFTNDASVLVSWAGTDSLSPPCSVRLGNAELVNVVAGSGFGTADTLWRYSGAQADGTSGMVSLPLGVDAAAVWQSLPAATYGALAGHWVRLSADALVQGWSGTDSTVGELEYGYLYTAEGQQSPDTLFCAAVTVDILNGPAACIGQDRLEHRFTCPAPSTITEYELQAAYVRCLVGGSQADTGLVWLDNLKLERFGTDSVFSGWLPPDSVQTWTLSSGDGRKAVWLAVQDVAGNETRAETCDSINLDETPPVAAIVEPSEGSKVNGEFKLLGAAYDPLAGQGQNWFLSYRLEYSSDGENWKPIDPQTEFFEPAVPTWDSTNLPPMYYPASLGYWNTEGLADGEYYVRLTVTDSAGNQSQGVTWYQLANGDGGDSENDASGPDGGGSGLGEGSILVGSATGVLRVYDEELNVLATRTVTDSGQAAYITAAVRHSPDTLILLNARAHTLLALGSTGEPVRLARGLGLPTGIAKDASGAYWLTDKLTGRLVRYKRGEGLELISDSLSGPEAVGARGDRVYVADTRNNRIMVYDTTGAELPSITGGFTGPQAIALPGSGGIYLTEPQTGTIKGITSDGTVYYTLNNTTVHKGLLSSPDGTRLYTLRPAGNRVLSYRIRSSDSLPGGGQAAGARNLPRTLTLNSPRPNPSNRQTQLSYGLPRASRVSIRLYDAAGRQCANLVDCQQKAGWYHLTWDGRNNGRALPAGVYFIQLTTDSGRMQRKLVRTQ